MLIDDAVLPAAAHLAGPGAIAVLRAALAAAGGELVTVRPCHVQYRPGVDAVVRYDATVSWSGRQAVAETLVAATTTDGPPAGTLPVEAMTPDGDELAIGVWRWPFDPVVTGLASAVTPSAVEHVLADIAAGPLTVEVVAYRPTQRAVVRVVDADGVVHYVKAVPPAEAPALARRHEALLAAGVPVPPVTRCLPELGLVAMAALDGPTVRERLKTGAGPWPDAGEYDRLAASLSAATVADARPVTGRADSALRHAAMLARVMPHDRWRLDRLTDVLSPAADQALLRSSATIHGDLYEAQLVTAAGLEGGAVIAGVLDVDDVGPGDPVDDRATVLAHLVVRGLDRELGAADRRAITAYAMHLRRRFAADIDPEVLDLVTAGALVGLATGPFRVQQHGWRREVRRRIGVAERFARHAGEEILSVAS